MNAAPLDIARSMNQVARSVGHRKGLQKVRSALVAGAVAAFPEIDHAGISVVHRRGAIETVAVTDDLVTRFDRLQYDLREGPCYEAITTGLPVAVAQHTRREERWPRYAPAAAILGLRSQIGLRLYTDRRTIGSLNLYSTASDTLSEETQLMAEVFATLATAAVCRAQVEDDMAAALSTRQLIGAATGITMERHDLDEAAAFAVLVRRSSTTNVKLRDVARAVCRRGPDPADDAPVGRSPVDVAPVEAGGDAAVDAADQARGPGWYRYRSRPGGHLYWDGRRWQDPPVT